MAEDSKSRRSVVGDVTKAISDAFEFFLPATVRAVISVAVIAVLGGSAPLRGAMSSLTGVFASVDVLRTADLLDKYKLAPLIPVVTLFVLATLAYGFNRMIFALSALIPIKFATSPERLLLGKCNAESVWKHMSYVETSTEFLQTMELELAKHRTIESPVITDISYWNNQASHYLQQFDFSKFLALWTVAWTVYLRHLFPSTYRSTIRVLGILFLISVWFSVSVLRAAYSMRQEGYAKVSAMLVLLTTQERLPTTPNEPPLEETKKAFIESQADDACKRGWWWLSFGWSTNWAKSITDMDVRVYRSLRK